MSADLAALTTVVVIVGPTAAGKSALAVEVARRLDGEIVNGDAMALYRGMDIGTAKPTAEQRGGVAHHLLDVWDISHEASVAEYQQRARSVIGEVHARGRLPILVGGSGLYIDAVTTDLRFPGTDPQVRAYWYSQVHARGLPAVRAELVARDPQAAAVIEPGNVRRIVRALEVMEITGEPFTARLPPPVAVYDELRIGLTLPANELADRISARVAAMVEAGLVGEVQALLARGLASAPTASRAVGYAQVMRALGGELAMSEALEQTVAATRVMARRQGAWFRRHPHIHWQPAPGDPEAIAALIGQLPAIRRSAAPAEAD